MCHAANSARRTAAYILTTTSIALCPLPAVAQDAPPAPEEEAAATETETTDGWTGEVSDEELLAMMSERPTLETGTGITGRVIDGTTGDPIIEGAVVVVERNRRVYTNLDGYFAVDVPPGTYTLRSFYELFQPTRVSDVVVTEGEATDVEITLEPDTESVAEELVVTARADTDTAATQIQIRRQSGAPSAPRRSPAARTAPRATPPGAWSPPPSSAASTSTSAAWAAATPTCSSTAR